MKLPTLSPCMQAMWYLAQGDEDQSAPQHDKYIAAVCVVGSPRRARAEIDRLVGRKLRPFESSPYYTSWLAALVQLWQDDVVVPWRCGSVTSSLHFALSINPSFCSDLFTELIADDLRWYLFSDDVYPHTNFIYQLRALI